MRISTYPLELMHLPTVRADSIPDFSDSGVSALRYLHISYREVRYKNTACNEHISRDMVNQSYGHVEGPLAHYLGRHSLLLCCDYIYR